MEDEDDFLVPMRFNLLAAAKERHKTIDEYIKGGWTRWIHIHEELAFDRLQGMQMDVDKFLRELRDAEKKTKEAESNARGRDWTKPTS
jgi:hypothetical protein